MNPSDESLWEIRVAPSAFRKLRVGPPAGLPSSAAFAAWEFINSPISRNPFRVGKTLQGGFAGKYSARRGDYRVIYLIDEDKHLVTVLDVGYRGHIYRRR